MRVIILLLTVWLAGPLLAQETDDLYFTSRDRKKKKNKRDTPGWVSREQVTVEKPDYTVDEELVNYYREEAAKLREAYRVGEDTGQEVVPADNAMLTEDFNAQGFAINQQNSHFSQVDSYNGYGYDSYAQDDMGYGNTQVNNYFYNDPYNPWAWNNNPWWAMQFPFQNSFFMPSYFGWGGMYMTGGFNYLWPSMRFGWGDPFWNPYWGTPFWDPFWSYNWGWGVGYCPPFQQPIAYTPGGENNSTLRRERVNGARVSRGGVVVGNESASNRTATLNRSALSTPVDRIDQQNPANRSVSRSSQSSVMNRSQNTQVNRNFYNRSAGSNRQVYQWNGRSNSSRSKSNWNTQRRNSRSNFFNRSSSGNRSFNTNRSSSPTRSVTPSRSASPSRSGSRSGGATNRSSSGNRKK